MKVAAALLISFCSVASAFVASPSRSAVTSALHVASTPDNLDSWSEKPLYRRESTTPVADRKVTKFERMMMPDVVVPPDFTLTWAVALLGPLIMWYHPCKCGSDVVVDVGVKMTDDTIPRCRRRRSF